MVGASIREYLGRLEASEEIAVLYAAESGSRAWGFASPDSDYDIRFIYVHRRDWYLSVQKRRDVLVAMIEPELDFAGWDLQKALPLLRKSNPSLLEWLSSPITYVEHPVFTPEIRTLAESCTSLEACLRHYLNMARSNWQTYFDEETVRLKKYRYVLRPIFACRWIERFRSLPPVEFEVLLAGARKLAGLVADEVARLLQAKAVTSELGVGDRRPLLDAFIVGELARFEALKMESKPPVEFEELDRFFRRWALN